MVLCGFGQRYRHAVAAQISGRGHREKTDFRNGLHNQRGIWVSRHAQSHVEAIGNQVDFAVVERQFQRHFRVAAAVFGKAIGHTAVGKPLRHGDAQKPLRRVGAAGGALGGGVERFERIAALAVIFFARFGEVQVAAVAVQKLGVDAVFQMAHMLAGHRYRNIKLVGRAGEAALLHHFAKHFQAEQSIHIFLLRNSYSIKRVYINQSGKAILRSIHHTPTKEESP